ncbi:MAG TPA: hypothetical protein VGL61_36870 [Kofleriaceae bacterium]
MRVALAIVAACAAPSTAAVGVNVPAPSHGPGTIVVTLAPTTPTKIVEGPFAVSSINPGSRLALAMGSNGCSGELAWFEYSGGGVAVGAGQTLCARSAAREPVTQGFSGHGE